jgi:opacity protein-like surface antigen
MSLLPFLVDALPLASLSAIKQFVVRTQSAFQRKRTSKARRDMRERNRLGTLLFIFIPLIAAMLATTAFAQARKTADRSSELDAFGGFTYLDSDYYDPRNNFGVTLGADYTYFIKHYHGLIIPSFQVRGTLTPGPADSQKTIAAGLKLATTYHRLHPYGDFLVGGGVITFPLPPNPIPGVSYRIRDSSTVYTYGGGITYDFRPNWSAMVDYQRQRWNLGDNPPDIFHPQAVTFGVVFHIPLKAYKTY